MNDKTEVPTEPKLGETWTNVLTGRVYRWDGKQWKWTGETVPVPFPGEFP